MDDLDGPRVEQAFIDQARRDLEWLGLDWDGPVQLESEGLEYIRSALDRLTRAGLVYPCVCSRKEIREAQSAPQEGVVEVRYPGTCRGRFDSIEAAGASGREVGLRFVAADTELVVKDQLSGEHIQNVQREVGDFLIARRDGSPAYQLAVVVDDARAQVTDVVRGDDLLPSTARQMLLQRALGLPTPAYYHLPLVVDARGKRLAKRHAALSLSELRARGVDARTIVTWVAASAGISTTAGRLGNPLGAADYLPLFDMAKVPRHSVSVSDDLAELLLGS